VATAAAAALAAAAAAAGYFLATGVVKFYDHRRYKDGGAFLKNLGKQ